MLTWKSTYSIHIEEIDAQHQHLVALINEFELAMKAGRGKHALEKTLADLIAYTQNHFATEERLMLEHHYPGLATHKAMHHNLTQQVVDLQRRYMLNKVGLSVTAANFLSDWLNYHILGQDKKFGNFLKARKATNPFQSGWHNPATMPPHKPHSQPGGTTSPGTP